MAQRHIFAAEGDREHEAGHAGLLQRIVHVCAALDDTRTTAQVSEVSGDKALTFLCRAACFQTAA
jgi:hypothetical protein